MPVYVFACGPCNLRFDEAMSIADRDQPIACPRCGESSRRLCGAPKLVGPTETKPLIVDQMGKKFTSAREFDRYVAQQPETRMFIDKNDSAWKNHCEETAIELDTLAKAAGFRDNDEVRRERQKRHRSQVAGRRRPG